MVSWFSFFDRQVLESGNLGKRKRVVIRQKKLKCSKSKVVNFTYNFEHNYSVFKFRIQSLTDFALQRQTRLQI